uniref:Putative poly(A) polymerase catalytic subunit n=1 Tax=Abalone asfa-like virus TaxID=2839893 RepID=A0A5K7XYJ2_9VIRU|nr:K421R homolog protein [Abalone asfa-like virus]BCY04544.1 hypothetical protein [Abalone asfa-like virus]
MYEALDIIPIVQTFADQVIQKDRSVFFPIYERIENFIIKHKLILCGNMAKKLILDDYDRDKVPIYELYSGSAFEDSKKLAQLIYEYDPDNLTRYTVLHTRKKHTEFLIQTNQREICRIHAISFDRHGKIFNLIKSTPRRGLFTTLQIRCIGPEFLLLDIYNILTNPLYANDWEKTLENEKYMREIFYDEIKDKLGISGGGPPTPVTKKQIINKIIHKFIDPEVHCIIGDYALPTTNNYQDRLQLITSNSLQYEQERLTELIPDIKCSIDLTQMPVIIPLMKLTVRIKIENHLVPILCIFDEGRYKIVPTITKHINSRELKIGNLFVQAKFFLLDIWTIQVLQKMGVIDQGFAASRLKYYVGQFRTIFKNLPAINKIFPLDHANYIGYYIDELLFLKRQKKAEQSMFIPPIFPISKDSAQNTAVEPGTPS